MTEPLMGMVQYYAFNWAPKYYALCNGAVLSIAQNSALFSLLGTTYGGNGQTTFALPNIQGRSVIGQGNGHSMGEMAGTPTVTMLTPNMPSHTHTVPNLTLPAFNDARDGGTVNDPNNAYPASPAGGGTMYTATAEANVYLAQPTVTVGITGSTAPFSVQNPYIAFTAAIATVGIYPSRN